MENKKIKIIYTGGGTMGSVSPLLAIHQNLKKMDGIEVESWWIGTPDGPEKKVVESEGIPFRTVQSGKLRRYFSWKNVTDIVRLKIGVWQSLGILRKEKPEIVLSAGGFVAVPVVIAAWLLRIPVLIHQQDLLAGLANKICAPVATAISVTFPENLKDYPEKKVFLAGNPVREEVKTVAGKVKSEVLEKIKLKAEKPILLVVGGGTGAQAINEFVWDNLDGLLELCQVVHLTGAGKSRDLSREDYRQFEYLKDELADYYFVADFVLSRAGLSFLTELSFLKKPTIVVPIPDSHQENNAEYFSQKGGVVYIKQKEMSLEKLKSEMESLLENESQREKMTEKMYSIFSDFGGEKIIQKILELVASNQ